MSEPGTPREAYQAIIDRLVSETTYSVHATLVETESLFIRNAVGIDVEFNKLVASLTIEQRGHLAAMLRAERAGAIHDVLASLTWWIEARDVGLTFQSEQLPVDLSGGGLHGDFVGRLQGDWEWPKEPTQ